MKYLNVEWTVAVPDEADVALLRSQAATLIPAKFYGLTDIVGRVYVYVEDEDDGQEAERPKDN